jgi:hypothetical protein
MKSYTQREKICGILSWLDDDAPETFDASFVYKMRDYYKIYGNLRPQQEQALNNIINGFDIEYGHFEDNEYLCEI